MKTKAQAILLCLVLAMPGLRGQEHEHLTAGAIYDPSEDPLGTEPLWFTNGALYATGVVAWDMPLALAGDFYAGYYWTEGFTMTSLAATPSLGGPEDYHAALGSFLRVRIVSVDGPAGGVFGYWAEASKYSNTSPSVSIPVGTTAGTFSFALTQAGGARGPEATWGATNDPEGHIHERGFTVNTPGLYTVGFQLFDSKGSHQESAIYYMDFQAIGVPEPGTIGLLLVAGGAALWSLRRRKVH